MRCADCLADESSRLDQAALSLGRRRRATGRLSSGASVTTSSMVASVRKGRLWVTPNRVLSAVFMRTDAS
jgi:hypothetical protein